MRGELFWGEGWGWGGAGGGLGRGGGGLRRSDRGCRGGGDGRQAAGRLGVGRLEDRFLGGDDAGLAELDESLTEP